MLEKKACHIDYINKLGILIRKLGGKKIIIGAYLLS
jgi:hypothetical protein